MLTTRPDYTPRAMIDYLLLQNQRQLVVGESFPLALLGLNFCRLALSHSNTQPESIVVTIVLYFVTLALYRLYLHPLSRFPGPKLMAVTRLYEGYYDLYKNDQYTFKITELHKQYGPIIRISPYELHVNDTAFFDTLYNRQEGNRRQPLSPFFSKVKKTVGLGAAVTAFVRDVVNEYIFGKHYNDLGKEDFDAGMVVAAQAGGLMWRITKVLSDPVMKEFFRFMIISMNDTKNFIKAAVSPDDDGPRTLAHEIMQSKLPPAEKSFEHVFEEISTITGAGFETTAAVIRIAAFHIYSDTKILQKLRAELSALPYLTATIMEAMRLSPAIATRSARIAQDRPHLRKLAHTSLHAQYPEPKRFNPDRFMDPDPWQLDSKTFVPFGKGKRNCIGMHLAWAKTYLLLGNLVQRFEFEFPKAKAEDFYVTKVNFALGTPCMGVIPALVIQVMV
ncbi:cytochrome P450 [Daldinia eschscholtzii]|nr:cytochrome P450 [Daldinia eschscholtzii]